MLQVARRSADLQVECQQSSPLVDDHNPLARHVATTTYEACPVVVCLVRSTHRVVGHREIMLDVGNLLDKLFGWRTMRVTRLASDRWIRDARVF